MIFDPDRQDDTWRLNLRHGLGAVLTLSGLGAALGVLLEIYALFVSPEELAVFQQLFSARVTITWQGGNLAVPSEILACSLPIILLLIAGGIATTLINGGLGLLRSKR